MLNWHDIRAMWVNGQQNEAHHAVLQMSEKELLFTIREALVQDVKLRGQSGDLRDLLEIVTFCLSEDS